MIRSVTPQETKRCAPWPRSCDFSCGRSTWLPAWAATNSPRFCGKRRLPLPAPPSPGFKQRSVTRRYVAGVSGPASVSRASQPGSQPPISWKRPTAISTVSNAHAARPRPRGEADPAPQANLPALRARRMDLVDRPAADRSGGGRVVVVRRAGVGGRGAGRVPAAPACDDPGQGQRRPAAFPRVQTCPDVGRHRPDPPWPRHRRPHRRRPCPDLDPGRTGPARLRLATLAHPPARGPRPDGDRDRRRRRPGAGGASRLLGLRRVERRPALAPLAAVLAPVGRLDRTGLLFAQLSQAAGAAADAGPHPRRPAGTALSRIQRASGIGAGAGGRRPGLDGERLPADVVGRNRRGGPPSGGSAADGDRGSAAGRQLPVRIAERRWVFALLVGAGLKPAPTNVDDAPKTADPPTPQPAGVSIGR